MDSRMTEAYDAVQSIARVQQDLREIASALKRIGLDVLGQELIHRANELRAAHGEIHAVASALIRKSAFFNMYRPEEDLPDPQSLSTQIEHQGASRALETLQRSR